MRIQDLHFRPFSSNEEYEACTRFQAEIWGAGFREQASAAIMKVANRIGGLAAGAFDGEGAIHGFVFGLTGLEDGELVHWSDMLAVRSELRDRGLGTALKWYQREVLLGRGVRTMRWTFDPLQSRNAHLNFRRLGIRVREYALEMYGDTGSPLHGGIGTDRFVATWEMDSPRVTALAEGSGGGRGAQDGPWPEALSGKPGTPFPRPGPHRPDLDEDVLLVAIPRQIDEIMREDMPLAVEWRRATREALAEYLGRGYEVRDLLPRGDCSYYRLQRVEHLEPEERAG